VTNTLGHGSSLSLGEGRPNDSSWSATTADDHQIVSFHDAALAVSRESLNSSTVLPIKEMDSTVHDIPSILARPMLLATGNIVPATDIIGSYSPWSLIVDPVIASKMENFSFSRGTLCLKLVVNADPFCFGRVLLTHVPFLPIRDVSRAFRTDNLTTITSFRYAELDIGSGQSTTFKIPYMGVLGLARLDDQDENEWGTVSLKMMSPLAGPNTAVNADFSLYGWFEDLQLVLPNTQSGTEIAQARNQTSFRDVASAFANYLPPPKETHTPWLAHLATGAMELFGLSRPTTTLPNRRVTNLPAAQFTNSTATDDSVVLALQPTNAVRLDPAIHGQQEDPLAFKNFLTHYQYIQTISWPTLTLAEASLSLIPVTTDVLSTRLGFVSDNFNFSRGTLTYRFSIVKSPFYSGRLAIEFVTPTSSVPASFTQMIPSVIWDVRTSKEMQVSVPYCSHFRYRRSFQTFSNVNVRVINPLKVTDGNPTSVEILVFMSANEDITFGLPKDPEKVYAQGHQTLADEDPDPPGNRPDERVVSLLPSAPLDPYSSAEIVMGESIHSLRPLLTRFTPLESFTGVGRLYDPLYLGVPATSNLLEAVSYYYQFFRGSLRYKFFVRYPPTDASGIPCPYYYMGSALIPGSGNALAPTPALVPPNLTNTPSHITYPHLNPVHEVLVPYYTNADRQFINITQPAAFGRCKLILWFDYNVITYPNPPIVDTYVAIGEDASFSLAGGCRVST